MLQLNNFSNQFIQDSNLIANSGEITAIIGPNGSGKTTLAKYIAGIYTDYDGDIKINGKIVDNVSADVALLLQNPYHQFIGIEVFDEVTYNLEQNNYSFEEIRKKLTEIPFDLSQKLLNLSGGQAQSLLILNYLMTDKEVFIFDETFSNLDHKLKQEMFDLIKSQNKVVILITNNIFDLKYADNVYQIIDQQLEQTNIQIPDVSYLVNQNEDVITIDEFVFENQKYDFTFKQGFNTLVGPSGSGKSTLIKAICGIEKTKINSSIQKSDCFYIGQYPFEQITKLKVSELVAKSKESEYFFIELGFMDGIFNRDIVSLSTGELVQVMLIHAWLSEKKLICLDESLEVLDYKKQQLILDICKKQNQDYIFVTHNPEIYHDQEVNEVHIYARN